MDKEVKLYTQLEKDGIFTIRTIYEFISNYTRNYEKVAPLNLWRLLASITSFYVAHHNDNETLMRYVPSCSSWFLKVWNPMGDIDEDYVFGFFASDIVKKYFEYYSRLLTLPELNPYLYLDSAHNFNPWDENLISYYVEQMSKESDEVVFTDIFLIYVAGVTGSKCPIFELNPYVNRLTATNLKEYLENDSNIGKLKSQAAFDKNREVELEMLDDVDDNYPIIGIREIQLAEIEQSLLYDYQAGKFLDENDSEVKSSLINIALGSAGRAAYESDYKQMARNYLTNVTALSDSDKENIINGHFSKYSPSEAYDIIVSVF